MSSPGQEELMASPSQTAEPSAMRMKRIEEKQELAHLNDRFLDYIQQVRRMKDTNLRLEIELQCVKEQLGKEAESVKLLYEAELSDARTLIDETAKEKARQQIISTKNAARVEELEVELKAIQEQLERLEGSLMVAERAAASSEAQRKSMQAEKAKLQKQIKELEVEVAELQSQLEAIKESLEGETLGKVDLQNNVQSLREELAFRKKVYEEELAALHIKLENQPIETVDFGHLLDSRLEAAIEELREKSEQEIAQYRIEVEATYRDKILSLEQQTSQYSATVARLNSEIRKVTGSLGDAHSEIGRLQKACDKSSSLLRDKDEELAQSRQHHGDEVARLVAELRKLHGSYETKIREYEELMDIRIQLDQEIATYRALLHEEETRLNITPTAPREKRIRPRAPMSEPVPKRPRLHHHSLQQQQQEESLTSSSAAGFIQVCDVEPSGKYVQIKNLSGEIESLGKFKIQHEVVGGQEVVFRFHPKSKLQGGHAVTVWAAKAEGAIHSPPENIIWKGMDTWGAGEKTITKLVSATGEAVATFTQRSEVKITPVKSKPAASRSSPSVAAEEGARSFPRVLEQTGEGTSPAHPPGPQPSFQQVGDEHMFHQKGDPRNRCRAS